MTTSTLVLEPIIAATQAGCVLVVEDERALRRANARILRQAGYDVIEAADGREACAAFTSRVFDAILTDITMPGMTGIELLRKIRAHDREVPVLLLTANPAVDSAIEAVEFGALKYLLKPIARRDLIENIDRAVELGRAARRKREAVDSMGGTRKLRTDRATMEASLDRGLKTLWMAYQPIVNWPAKTLFAYEALLRSNEPSLPDPGAMLTVAGHLGRLSDVGRAVRACVARTMTENEPHASVFVNLHPADLHDETLYSPDAPLSAFANRVVLEITERAALVASGDLRARMDRLRGMGYRIAVDDLGAGYSGLNYFAQLAPDVAKIDMWLIRDIHRDEVKRSLVRSLVALCEELGVVVIAEGVETIEERDAVAKLGCNILQGFLFAKPSRPFPGVAW